MLYKKEIYTISSVMCNIIDKYILINKHIKKDKLKFFRKKLQKISKNPFLC